MKINTIRAQYGGSFTSYLIYSKPYTKCIDNMRMPNEYQPPEFLQFDGKGNPKQFVRSLKGNAFDWYTDLESESIDSWEQIGRAHV